MTPELPLTGTGWQPAPTASYPGPAPAPAGYQPYGAIAEQQTRELPAVSPRDTIAAMPARSTATQPEPVIFQQVRQASPWLRQNGPTSEVHGEARRSAEFDTDVDAAWRAARSAGEPTPAGATAPGAADPAARLARRPGQRHTRR